MPTPIPGPPGLPILGNVLDVNPNETWNSLNKLAAQYGTLKTIASQHTHLYYERRNLTVLLRPHFQDYSPRQDDRIRLQCGAPG